MAAPVRFLSGRQQQQKIGIEGSTQNEKVLEVVGRVGIGTTVFDTTKALDVRGDVEISGIISATRFLGDGSQLANLPASGVGATDNVNTSGIITAGTFSGKGDFTNLSVSGLSTFSSTVDINSNLDVTGHTELDNVNVAGITTFNNADVVFQGAAAGQNITFDASENDLEFTDAARIKFGNNDDLEIWHDAPNSNIKNSTGDFHIRSDSLALKTADNSERYLKATKNQDVKLYYNGNEKFATTGAGVTVFGNTETQTLNVTGVSTFVGLVTVTTGDVHIAQRLFVGGLEVEGTGSENTFTGINTFTNQQDNVLGNTNTGSLQGNGGLGIDKNASFGDKVFVQNAIGINSTAPIGKLDVNGHTELDDVNVSAALTAASLNVTNKLTTTGLGISVANGTGNTAYIEGPSEIWIDPAPAGAGTTSGLVRIRGDLYVDGTEFIVDVDKVQLSDYRIGIATTAGTNALLDGAGLGIGSESIEKTITWNNATSALMSSENWNLASGKHYEIAGTDVLTSTTLGGGVVNSSLTSVGTLGSLTVSGDITANGNIVGDNATNISNINQVTATTFSGALSGNATSATTATNVTVADESSDTTCNVLFTTGATGNLAPKSGTNLTFNSANGTLTATEFSGGGAGITGLTASQVGALADIVSDTTPQLGGNLDVNNKDITGTGNVNLTGIVTATNFVGGGAGLTGITAGQVGAITDLVSDTTPQLGGNLDLNSKLINGTGGINVTGIVTASSFDGNITGIATYTSEWIITSNGSSDYKFTGPGFDGTELDPTIYLVRGQEYKFTNNMGAHPFQIRTAINGSAYNDGISNNGVSNGTLTWDVQMDAPNVLYYQCTAHAGMVGKIYIGNSGDSVNVGTGVTINAGGINVTGVVTATSFIGNGAGLTGLTANQVGAIGDVVSDTTPQLGGNLDLNSKTINGTGTINFTGNVTATAFAGSGANLTSLPVPTEVIVTDESSDTSCNVLFTTAATGNLAPKSGTNLTFNSSSGTLTATAFSGDGSALTNLPAGTTIPVADESSDTECFLVFTTAATGNQAPKTGTNLTFNSSNGTLTATTFSGSGASLTAVDAATLDGVDSTSFLRSDAADTKTSGSLTFSNNVQANFGVFGAGLEIYHNGSHSYIQNTRGNLYIESKDDDKDIFLRSDDGSGNLTHYLVCDGSSGSVQIHHYSSKKFETTSTGVNVTGDLTLTDTDAGSAAGPELKLFRNSASPADADYLGQIKFAGESDTGVERNYAKITGKISDASNTTEDGILEFAHIKAGSQTITGRWTSTELQLLNGTHFSLGDSQEIRVGGSDDLLIYHDGSNSYIKDSGTGNLLIQAESLVAIQDTSGNNSAIFNDGGTVELYHNNSLKFTTQSTGIDVTGEVQCDSLDVDGVVHITDHGSGGALRIGEGNDLQIYHVESSNDTFIREVGSGSLKVQATDFHIESTSGDNMIICDADGSVDLYYNTSKKLETTSGGVTVTGILTATSFSGALTGNADTATTATNFTVTANNGTNENVYLVFVDGATGSQGAETDTALSYNPSTDTLTAGTFSGALSGNGSAVTNLNASNLSTGTVPAARMSGTYNIESATFTVTANNSANETVYPVFVDGATGSQGAETDTGLSYNPSTGALTATTFSGSGASLTAVDAATLDGVDSTSFLRSDAADSKTSGDLTFNDNIKAKFGTSGDLEIYHDGTHSRIHNYTGTFYVASTLADANVNIQADDGTGTSITNYLKADGSNGEAQLFHYGSKKLATKSSGISVTGLTDTDTLNVSGGSTFNDTVHLPANVQLRFDSNNTTDSLRIYDDGSNSRFISDHGIFFGTDSVWAVLNESQNSYKIRANSTNVLLYHSGSTKFETTSTGVDVTGTITADGLDMEDSQKILLGTGDDLEIYHDGSNNVIKTASNQNLQLYSTGAGAVQIQSDSPKLIFDDVTGGSQIDISMTLDAGAFTMADDTNSDTFFKYTQNDAVEIYHNNSKKFETTGYGATVTGGLQVSGIVTATSFEGDGSALTGISAGGSPEFYTGITSSRQIAPLSFETAVFTFPSTSGRQYVIESINVANVDESVGVGTTVNIIASIEDATAAEQTYIAYNVPIVTGGLIELLKNPIVAGPSDVIRMWTTSDTYVGVNNAADVYINYTEFESTDYISKFASSTTITSTDAVTLYTSTGNPTMIEKIGFANRTDTGDFPVSIKITNGVTTSYLAKNLIIPRYSTVDILDRHKRIETGAKIEVEVGSTNTVDVIISGKKITS